MANYGKEEGTKLIANNKKAYHDYFVDVTYECGIELAGTEVKSLRLGQCSIKEAYCNIKNGEVWIYGMHINPYEKGNIFDRKLLLHKTEIRKLSEKLKEQGYALIPLRVYFRKSLVKVEIGLCRGKKLYDKRADLQKKQQKRDLERDFKGANLRV